MEENGREEIRLTRREWVETFSRRDADGIMAFYSPEISVFDVMPPLSFDGLASNRANWVNFFGQFDSDIVLSSADERITLDGKVAFVRGFTRMQSTMNGQPYDMWTRETNCLRKVEAKWLIVHAHTSIPVDFKTMHPCTKLVPADALP